MRFAQIFNGKAHWIFDADTKPDFASNIVLVDITGVTPAPSEGWLYDGANFLPPPPPPLRPVPGAVFLNLFTDAELIALENAARTSGLAAAFLRRVQIAPAISSTDPRVQAAMTAMVTAGILTAPRATAILGAIG